MEPEYSGSGSVALAVEAPVTKHSGTLPDSVSHELGNPLFVILGYSELILADSEAMALSETTKRRLKVISEMALRASEALHRFQ